MMFKFYAVAGRNGLGIYLSRIEASNAQNYLQDSQCIDFVRCSDSIEYARSYYNRMSGRNYNGPILYNFTLYNQDIDEIERLGLGPNDTIRVIHDGTEKRHIARVDMYGRIINPEPLVIFCN